MNKKKLCALMLSVVTAFAVIASPANLLTAEATTTGVVTVLNKASNMSRFSIQTDKYTTCTYAGITYEQSDMGVEVQLFANDTCINGMTLSSVREKAASIGANYVRAIDVKLQQYYNGWSKQVDWTYEKLRICMSAPETSGNLDYAIISIKTDGSLEVLGDLDNSPEFITFDTDNFRTFAIVSGPKGAFDQYRVACQGAINKVPYVEYIRNINSSIDTKSTTSYVFGLAVQSTADQVKAASGIPNPAFKLVEMTPGKDCLQIYVNALKKVDARGVSYYNASLYNYYSGAAVTKTNSKLRLCMSVPYNNPLFADYALAVLNTDGSVSILPDIDQNASTITVDTDTFRVYAIIYGKPGAFDAYK